jgi:outer membrane receptor for ferrienterochelin and colicins
MRFRDILMLQALATGLSAQTRGSEADLTSLSLDSLLNVSIQSSVKYEQRAADAPASITLVTREDIHRYGYRTLDEVLRRVRGFYVNYDRNYATIGTRGFGRPTDYNDRLLLLINGHVYNDDIYQTAALGTDLGLDLDAVDRIEVIRGPNSTLYGTSAMLGVINVVTADGSRHPGPAVSVETGSGRKREGAARYGRPLGGGGNVFLAGSWGAVDGRDLYFREYDDPGTNGGRAVGLDWDRYAGFSGRVSAGGFSAQAFAAQRTKGIPTASWDVRFNDARYRSFDQRAFLEAGYERDLGRNRHGSVRLSLDHYRFTGWYPYETLEREDAHGTWINLEGQFRWDPFRRLRVTFGGRIQDNRTADYRYRTGGENSFEGDFPFSLFSFYGQAEFRPGPGLILMAGLGRDAYSTSFHSVMPRASAIFRPFRSTTSRAVYAEGFRAPNVYESNYEEPDFQKRNPNLRPERIRTFEWTIEQRISAGLRAAASAYRYSSRGLIEYSLDPDENLYVFENLQRVAAAGFELELNGRFGRWSAYGSCSFQRARDRRSGKTPSNSPEWLARAGGAVSLGGDLTAAAEVEAETGRRTLAGSKTPAFGVVDLNLAGIRPAPRVEAEIKVRNLLDARYRLPGGSEHRMDSIVQDGRSFALRITFSL